MNKEVYHNDVFELTKTFKQELLQVFKKHDIPCGSIDSVTFSCDSIYYGPTSDEMYCDVSFDINSSDKLIEEHIL